MRLSSFFTTPSKWTKNASARNIHGQPINLNEYNSEISSNRETRVESLSLQGALAYFYSQEKEPEKRERELIKLKKAIELYTGETVYLAQFNDRAETTFNDVRKVLNIYEKL